MKVIFLLLISLLLSSCNNSSTEVDTDWKIEVFGKIYICEDYRKWHSIYDCQNSQDAQDKIAVIYQATNIVEVENTVNL